MTSSQELGRVTLGAHQQEGAADRPPVAGGAVGAWYCSIYRSDFNHLAEDQSGGSKRLHLSLAPPPFGHSGVFDDSNISRCLLSWIRHQTKTKICLLEKIDPIHLSEVPECTTVAPPCGRRPGADKASPNNWTPPPPAGPVSTKLAEVSLSLSPLGPGPGQQWGGIRGRAPDQRRVVTATAEPT